LKPIILCGKPPKGLKYPRYSFCPSGIRMGAKPEEMK